MADEVQAGKVSAVFEVKTDQLVTAKTQAEQFFASIESGANRAVTALNTLDNQLDSKIASIERKFASKPLKLNVQANLSTASLQEAINEASKGITVRLDNVSVSAAGMEGLVGRIQRGLSAQTFNIRVSPTMNGSVPVPSGLMSGPAAPSVNRGLVNQYGNPYPNGNGSNGYSNGSSNGNGYASSNISRSISTAPVQTPLIVAPQRIAPAAMPVNAAMMQQSAYNNLNSTLQSNFVQPLNGMFSRVGQGWRDAILQTERESMRHFMGGALLSGLVTYPLMRGAGAAIGMASDYQTRQRHISALTDIPRNQLPELNNQVRQAVRRYGRDPMELVEGQYFIGSTGYNARQVGQTLGPVAMGSASGLGTIKTVANTVTTVNQVYGKDATNSARAVDILTEAVKQGKGEAASYAPALGKVAASAKLLGISFEEVAANVATFTRAGVTANTAGVALNMLLKNLQKPSKTAEEALEALGMSADSVRKSLREKGLLSTLQEMWEKSGHNSAIIAKLVGSVTGLRDILTTTGAQGEAYAGILDKINHSAGATERAFKEMSGTVEVQWARVTNTLKMSAIDITSHYLPSIGDATEALADKLPGQIDRITAAFEALPQPIKTATGIGVGMLASAGPILMARGTAGLIRSAGMTAGSAVASNWRMGLGAGALYNAFQDEPYGGRGTQLAGDAYLAYMASRGLISATQGAFTSRAAIGGALGNARGYAGNIRASAQGLWAAGGMRSVMNMPINSYYAPGGYGGGLMMGGANLGSIAVSAPLAGAATIAGFGAATAYENYLNKTNRLTLAHSNIGSASQGIEGLFGYAESAARPMMTAQQAKGRTSATGLLTELKAQFAAVTSGPELDAFRAKVNATIRDITGSKIKLDIDDRSTSLFLEQLNKIVAQATPTGQAIDGIGSSLRDFYQVIEDQNKQGVISAYMQNLHDLGGAYGGIASSLEWVARAWKNAEHWASTISTSGQGGNPSRIAGYIASNGISPGIASQFGLTPAAPTPLPPGENVFPGYQGTHTVNGSLEQRVANGEFKNGYSTVFGNQLSTENGRIKLYQQMNADYQSGKMDNQPLKMRFFNDVVKSGYDELRQQHANNPAETMTTGAIDAAANAKKLQDDAMRRSLQKQESGLSSYISSLETVIGKVRGFGEETEEARVRNEMLALSLKGVSREYQDNAIKAAKLYDEMNRLTGLRDGLRGLFDEFSQKAAAHGQFNVRGMLGIGNVEGAMGYRNGMTSLGQGAMRGINPSYNGAIVQRDALALQRDAIGMGTVVGVTPGPWSPGVLAASGAKTYISGGKLMTTGVPNGLPDLSPMKVSLLPVVKPGSNRELPIIPNPTIAGIPTATMSSALAPSGVPQTQQDFYDLTQSYSPNYDGSLVSDAPKWLRDAWGRPITSGDKNAEYRRKAQGYFFSQGLLRDLPKMSYVMQLRIRDSAKATRASLNRADMQSTHMDDYDFIHEQANQTRVQMAQNYHPSNPMADLQAQLANGDITPERYQALRSQRRALAQSQAARSLGEMNQTYATQQAGYKARGAGLRGDGSYNPVAGDITAQIAVYGREISQVSSPIGMLRSLGLGKDAQPEYDRLISRKKSELWNNSMQQGMIGVDAEVAQRRINISLMEKEQQLRKGGLNSEEYITQEMAYQTELANKSLKYGQMFGTVIGGFMARSDADEARKGARITAQTAKETANRQLFNQYSGSAKSLAYRSSLLGQYNALDPRMDRDSAYYDETIDIRNKGGNPFEIGFAMLNAQSNAYGGFSLGQQRAYKLSQANQMLSHSAIGDSSGLLRGLMSNRLENPGWSEGQHQSWMQNEMGLPYEQRMIGFGIDRDSAYARNSVEAGDAARARELTAYQNSGLPGAFEIRRGQQSAERGAQLGVLSAQAGASIVQQRRQATLQAQEELRIAAAIGEEAKKRVRWEIELERLKAQGIIMSGKDYDNAKAANDQYEAQQKKAKRAMGYFDAFSTGFDNAFQNFGKDPSRRDRLGQRSNENERYVAQMRDQMSRGVEPGTREYDMASARHDILINDIDRDRQRGGSIGGMLKEFTAPFVSLIRDKAKNSLKDYISKNLGMDKLLNNAVGPSVSSDGNPFDFGGMGAMIPGILGGNASSILSGITGQATNNAQNISALAQTIGSSVMTIQSASINVMNGSGAGGGSFMGTGNGAGAKRGPSILQIFDSIGLGGGSNGSAGDPEFGGYN